MSRSDFYTKTSWFKRFPLSLSCRALPAGFIIFIKILILYFFASAELNRRYRLKAFASADIRFGFKIFWSLWHLILWRSPALVSVLHFSEYWTFIVLLLLFFVGRFSYVWKWYTLQCKISIWHIFVNIICTLRVDIGDGWRHCIHFYSLLLPPNFIRVRPCGPRVEPLHPLTRHISFQHLTLGSL